MKAGEGLSKDFPIYCDQHPKMNLVQRYRRISDHWVAMIGYERSKLDVFRPGSAGFPDAPIKTVHLLKCDDHRPAPPKHVEVPDEEMQAMLTMLANAADFGTLRLLTAYRQTSRGTTGGAASI